MSDFTQLEIIQPIVTSPVPEIVYDKLWIDMLTFTFPSPQQEGTIYARMIPCRDNPEIQNKELKPVLKDGDIKVVTANNIYYHIATDPEIAMAFEMILRSVRKLGIIGGVLKDPTNTITTTTTTTTTTTLDNNTDSNIITSDIDVDNTTTTTTTTTMIIENP